MAKRISVGEERIKRLKEARENLAILLETSVENDARERERGTEISTDDDDFVDMAQDVAVQEDREAILAMLRRDLRAFDEAWQKAEAGTYGICADCGQDIPQERLELMPESTLCVACQTRRERAWFGAR